MTLYKDTRVLGKHVKTTSLGSYPENYEAGYHDVNKTTIVARKAWKLISGVVDQLA